MISTGLIGIAFVMAMVSVIALGMAFFLDVAASRLGLVLRSIIAAIVAGALAVAFPIFTVIGAVDDEALFVVLLPLLILGFVLALVLGFPIAYFFSKRRQRGRDNPIEPEIFE